MKPVLVVPSTRELQAGAIWVTVLTWVRACQRRFGGAVVLDAEGELEMSQVLKATGLHSKPVFSQRQSPVRKALSLLYKDARSFKRGRAQRRALRSADTSAVGPWVWQHHDLFRWSGFDLARRASVPILLFVDAPIVWEAAKWGTVRPGWGRLLERIAETPQLKRADLVLCISEEVAEACIDRGARPDRVLVLPTTADPANYEGDDHLRTKLDLTNDVVIGWVGSFRSFHHLDVLVEAVGRVSKAQQGISLLLVGDGADRKRILDLSDQFGVNCVAPGAVTHDEIPPYLRTMDIAVLPAGHDQDFHYSPLKLKEFLAAGRATVAPKIGEMDRVLTHDQDVRFYEAGDVGALAEELSQLVSDPDLRQRIGDAGRATCERLFSIDRQLERVDNKLKELGLLSQ